MCEYKLLLAITDPLDPIMVRKKKIQNYALVKYKIIKIILYISYCIFPYFDNSHTIHKFDGLNEPLP